MTRGLSSWLLCMALFGCAQGGGAPRSDAGMRGDAGGKADDVTPRADAGVSDAGRALDAGTVSFDAGRDSSVPDTGVDAGWDAGRDSAPSCAESPCDPLEQCGCSAGLACVIDDEGLRACRSVGGRGEGAACSSSTACQAGLICTGEPQGGCWRLCESDVDCIGAGSRCMYDVTDSQGAAVPGARICSLDCSPAGGGGCPSGWTCALNDDAGGDYTYCRRPGSAGAFGGCTRATDCEPGHACLESPTGDFLCYPYCTYPAGPECGAGARCYDQGFVIGSTNYGVCGAA
jgi:hypothetical protein